MRHALLCNSFTAHVACQVHCLPSMARSPTPLTALYSAHGICRAHRMPRKPLAVLYYARRSPGLTPLAVRSAARARLPGRAPGARLHERARAPARSASHERPPARAARSTALALFAYFQLRARRRRPLPARYSSTPTLVTSLSPRPPPL
jgi:hypothetical protein